MPEFSASAFEAGYQAAQTGAALFDLDDWTCLSASGSDAVKFLQNFCTNNVETLGPGEGCEAFLTNVKARILGHVLVYRNIADDGLRLLTSPGQAAPIMSHLDKYVITEDVTIRDETHEQGLLGLVGPAGAGILESLGATVPASTEAHSFASEVSEMGEESVLIMSFDGFQLPVFLIATPVEAMERLSGQLSESGAVRADLDVLNSLRIEAVYPWGGFDVDDSHLAPEADRPWAISFTKGCYLGQEPIARIDARGHVNRVLRGLRLDEETVPEPGTMVYDGEKSIGEVRSTGVGGTDGKVLALALVRASHAAEGTRVVVGSESSASGAVVFGGR